MNHKNLLKYKFMAEKKQSRNTFGSVFCKTPFFEFEGIPQKKSTCDENLKRSKINRFSETSK